MLGFRSSLFRLTHVVHRHVLHLSVIVERNLDGNLGHGGLGFRPAGATKVTLLLNLATPRNRVARNNARSRGTCGCKVPTRSSFTIPGLARYEINYARRKSEQGDITRDLVRIMNTRILSSIIALTDASLGLLRPNLCVGISVSHENEPDSKMLRRRTPFGTTCA